MSRESVAGIRWGIAGPGAIAARFADGMRDVEGGRVVAVASRAAERAEAFAARFDIPHHHGSYEALADDPNVDVVYVATPHSRHAVDTLLFISAGKHVLCEKPFALNASQANDMVRAAEKQQRFVMEAMWSRFLPAYRALGDVLGEERVGEPLLVEASFGWRTPEVVPTDRHFDLAQGGGALLDLGVYTVNLSQFVLGPVESVGARGHVGTTGVDEHVAAVLQHSGDRLGVVQAAIRAPLTCTARIACTSGVIDIPAFMHCPDHLVLRTPAGEERIDAGWEGEGLRFQAEEVHRCLEAGLLESPVMPWRETIGIAEVLDSIRAQVGVRYPGE
jgi:predicted dehydrogenase